MDDGCFGSPLKVSRCGLHHLYYLLLNLLEREKKKKVNQRVWSDRLMIIIGSYNDSYIWF